MSQTERIKYIDDEINNKGYVRIKYVAINFEVTEKTVKRDIEYLRDRLNAPIKYKKSTNQYFYSGQFRLFDFLGNKNLIFYVFLKSLLDRVDFIPLYREKILDDISKNLSKKHLDLSDDIYYELPAHEFPDDSILKSLIDGMSDKKQCLLEYVNINGKESQRMIEPLKIMNYSGLWYTVSYCHKSGEIRTFELSRMKSLVPTDKPYESTISDESLKEYIFESFGILKGKMDDRELINVTVRFYDKAMMIVRKQIWHKSQKVEEKKENGKRSIEFTFPVSGFEEVLGKVLQYGENAEVISPIEFRKLWLNTIKKMCEKFC